MLNSLLDSVVSFADIVEFSYFSVLLSISLLHLELLYFVSIYHNLLLVVYMINYLMADIRMHIFINLIP